MCNYTKRRIVAFILAVAALLTSLPTGIFAITTSDVADSTVSDAPQTSVDVEILHEGASKNSITLAEDGKETLTARVNGTSFNKRTWQILDPERSSWINIYGKNQETLDVTYALVGSMLNDSGKAYVRVQVGRENEYFVSDPVEILLSYNVNSALEDEVTESFFEADSYSARIGETGSVLFDSQTDSESPNDFITYSIVINYIFDNGGLAFEPYGATVAAGSDFHLKQESRKVVGYMPYTREGDSYVDASLIERDYYNIQEDITINVIYRPAIVDFQIHHHYQDVLDDAYSAQPDQITYGKALTGSTVPDGLALTIPGFKALAYEKLTVAADGSTVVEIRYDRDYYLITFELDGGFGTEPIYTRYGTSIGANPPTKPGYLFDGWTLTSYGGEAPSDAQKAQYDINSALITVPNAKLVYTANWITQVTGYTMVFWKENINDNGFTFWSYKEYQAMSGSYVSGADKVSDAVTDEDVGYFTYCDPLTDKNVLVEGDGSTIVNVYYTRNRYSITFKAPGLCVIPGGHTHSDSCYVTFCKGGHIHGAECNPTLTCPTEEHTAHTDACIICGIEEHTHSDACCNTEVHTHTVACYNNVGNAQTPYNAPSNATDGQIYRFLNYYIYIGGKWYRYNGRGVSSGDIVDSSCGKENHVHTDGCCSIPEHTHSDVCYRDTLHTHNDYCYSYSCGLTAHEHSDSCYVLNCGIPTGHTHSSTCKNASSTNTVKIVYRKYQQNLGKDPDNFDSDEGIWPIVDDNGVVYDDGQRWEPSGSSIYNQVLVYIANMPGESFTLTVNTSNNSQYTMNYYLEVLPNYTGETVTYDGKRFVLYTTILARYSYLTKAEDFFDIKGFVQYTSSPAFGSNGQISISGSNRVVNLYYTRETDHWLNFRNNGVIMDDKSVHGIQYGESLSQYEFVPDYPAELEPNAFFFDGWYTSPGHFDGTEVDWDTITMEAGGVLLYAKWSPVVHTVSVYTDNTYSTQVGETQNVPHGNFALPPDGAISNGNYIFQGWFYEDVDQNGNKVEKAFVFNGIPVLEDLKIYAKWSSHVSVNYTINYKIFETEEIVAPATVGSAIAGHNKTFYAKAGDELNAGYREGYFPLTTSHTVTMRAEEDHEFTFYYVYVKSVPYAVRYLDENGDAIFTEKRIMDNRHSVVTETFLRVDGMMPDAYQKRLVISADGTDADNDGIADNNVITFNYTSDTEHAYYRVVHYIQNLSGDGYREYRSIESVGVIGEDCTAESITLTGFSLNGSKTVINGVNSPTSSSNVTATLGSDGLLIELYYDRQNVTYKVNYLESETNKVLYSQKIGNGIFGAEAVEYAPGLTSIGYTLVSESVKQIQLSTNEELNVINFYYQEAVYSIKYHIVGPADSGSLSIESENVDAVTGDPVGSYPIVRGGYSFHGWYLDEACVHPVDPSWVDSATNQLTPVRDGIWTQNHDYYAKIDPDFTSLTIKTSGAFDIDVGQVFLFRIKGTSTDTASVDMTVMIVGNSSVTISGLRVGSYSVTELVSWSYRYTPDSETKYINLSVNVSQNTITFSHIRDESKWLDGGDVATNIFAEQ